ncbi:MAG: hypothetical protein KC731_35260 [Myxococcales bacterium]|nr:hypothetical protein [Myxococcales bacterium]
MVVGVFTVGLAGCSAPSPPPPHGPTMTADATASAAPAAATSPAAITRRPLPSASDGKPLRRGISYGPYREGHHPAGPYPSEAEIAEDLKILATRWQMIRIYGSRGPAETILRVIRDQRLPLSVMVGAWIAPRDEPGKAAENEAEVKEAIVLANAYPEQVMAVSVGNETQVFWSGHRSPRDELIEYIRTVRAAVKQPVTTADDYNFWNKPESHAVADEVDFLLLHAYAMWNGKSLEESVPWTADTLAAIAEEHPDLAIVLGETGWATELNPEGGEQATIIVAPAGEAEQKVFYEAFTSWAEKADQAYFYFEAFDEPWKGGDDPREIEKHWGLYDVDRTPKKALESK